MLVNQHDSGRTEIIQNRLYWICGKLAPSSEGFCFSIDQEYQYYPFSRDFGPFDLGVTYRYCKRLQGILATESLQSKLIFHYTVSHPHNRANSAYLLGAFLIIVLKKTSKEAAAVFSHVNAMYRDALDGPCSYFCSLSDCFDALEQAIRRGWFKYESFNVEDYEFYSKMINGDLNWIIPNQFLAFSSPSASKVYKRGQNLPVDTYSSILKSLGVRTIVRLNEPCYPIEKLKENGIKVYELFFDDGSVPSLEIVSLFINISISERGAVGVHCKAGLGRTGTLIGCYAIKIFKFPAAAFIAWCRICRPGSILGSQQQFLIDFEESLIRKKANSLVGNVFARAKFTKDPNQAEKLLLAKAKRFSLPSSRPPRESYEKKSSRNLGEDRGTTSQTSRFMENRQSERRKSARIEASQSFEADSSQTTVMDTQYTESNNDELDTPEAACQETPSPMRMSKHYSSRQLSSGTQKETVANNRNHYRKGSYHFHALKNVKNDRLFSLLYGTRDKN